MRNNIRVIFIIAFIIRLTFSYINFNIGYLPQGGADAVRFDYTAYDMMMYPENIDFSRVVSSGVHFHIWTGSLIYSVFGRSPFIWSFFLIIMTTWAVYNIHQTVYIITKSYKRANMAGWVACLFPNFVLLSSLILREAPIYFFISLSLLYLTKYLVQKKNNAIIGFYIFGIIGSVYHTAVFAFIFGFLAYSVFVNKQSSKLSKVAVVVLGVALLAVINITGFGLSKFGGSFDSAFDTLSEEQTTLDHAGSNYPQWLLLRGSITDLLMLPIRMIAFLFSPFIPFFARTASHMIGVFDGILYFLIVRLIYLNRRILIKSNAIKAIGVIAISMILVFSMGASNFGTNIRHRSKVLPVLLTIPIYTKKDRKRYDKYIKTIKK